MSTIEQLLKPVFGGGIRSVNFFNGRVLTGEDLSDEQEAQRQARRLLGRAVGEGVAHGLEVSEAPESSTSQSPVITVEPGIAVNRAGQTLRLGERTEVGLVRREDAPAGEQVGVTFRDCAPLRHSVYVPSESVYLLTVAPAEGREGRAPAAGGGSVPSAFNTRYLVEGVQFRLIEAVTGSRVGDLATLRNRVAYSCFGVESTRHTQSNPFGPALESYGLLDGLRPELLTDCEVPLALIYWSNVRGLEFIDMWAARRRLTEPAHSRRWHALVGDRRAAESEAMVLQFQDQVADMYSSVNLSAAVVTQNFRYLPPAGLLPEARRDATGKNFNGVNPATFFGARLLRGPDFVDGAVLRSLLADAAHYEPVDVTRGDPVWVYRVVQNEQAFNAAANIQPYVVFTNAQMPFRGAARLDLARFDLSNLL
jgi:hypothetical protein